MNALMPLVGAVPLDNMNIHQFKGFCRKPLADCSFDDDWFVFTAVRHPIDRAVSAWRDKVGNPNQINVLRKNGIEPGDSFEYFVRVISLWPSKALDRHAMPQTQILYHAKGLPLKIFHFEDLGSQWSIITQEIEQRSGLRIAPLGKVNASVGVWPEITPQLALKLNRLYADDFSAWYSGSYDLDLRDRPDDIPRPRVAARR